MQEPLVPRDEETAILEMRTATDRIRQGLTQNAQDQAALAGSPTQAQVLAVVRRLLVREEHIIKALRALGRWVD
jgi:hypothetical protein